MTRAEFEVLSEMTWAISAEGHEFRIAFSLGSFRDWHRLPVDEWTKENYESNKGVLMDISYTKCCQYLKEQS